MYDIYIDGKSCVRLGIFPVKRPDIPAPHKRIKEYEVLGRDGKLYEDTGNYEDIELSMSFNYMSSQTMWADTFRKCKLLFKDAKEIQFSDDVNYFYKIKKVDINTNERVSKQIGKFDVAVTIDPYVYLMSGKNKIRIQNNLMNFYDACEPVYIIKGEGLCHLYVNDNEVLCNVSGTLTIDTHLKLSFRNNGELANTAVKCDYDELILKNGLNTLSASQQFLIEVIPNWRCI